MKNFNIMGVHWKIRYIGIRQGKTNIQGELPKKGELGQFADLRGGGGGGVLKKGGGGVVGGGGGGSGGGFEGGEFSG